MILGHHGGEAPLLQAALATAGSLSITLALFRAELFRLGRQLRRGPRRDNETRADGAATKPGGER